MEALAEAKKRELELLNDEERKLDMELAALSRQLDFFVQQAAAFMAERTKSAAMHGGGGRRAEDTVTCSGR